MKCPKCGSRAFDLLERFAEVETRQVRDGVVSDESWHDVGPLLSTECHCGCGHQWHPRRASLETLQRPWDAPDRG